MCENGASTHNKVSNIFIEPMAITEIYSIDDDDDDVIEIKSNDPATDKQYTILDNIETGDSTLNNSKTSQAKSNNNTSLVVDEISLDGSEKENPLHNNISPNNNKMNKSINENVTTNKDSDVINSENLDDDCVITEIVTNNENNKEILNNLSKYEEYSTLFDLVNTSLNIDDSIHMQRIFTKHIIPMFKKCKLKHVNTEKLKEYFKRTERLVKKKPDDKYLHLLILKGKMRRMIKKLNQTKVITPSEDVVQNKPKQQIRRIKPITLPKAKKFKVNETVSKVSELNTQDDDLIFISNTNNETIEIESDDDVLIVPNSPNINNSNITEAESTTHLEKRFTLSFDDYKKNKIKFIENTMALLKVKLEKYETREVVTDSVHSPYIQCEMIKKQIVNLYAILCNETKTESIKRHKVRFKVNPGHPEGPVKCLEEFINSNIDGSGNPPFPDIADVIQCVTKANTLYNLQWSRKQINDEAKILLKHYGEALQARRKKREWRDLVSICKQEIIDPAETDPVLEAKLQANRAISKKKESEIFDKYVQLEEKWRLPQSNLNVQMESSDDSDYDDHSTNISSSTNYTVQDSTVLKSCVANNVVYDDHCYTGNSSNISNSANSKNSTNYTVHNTVQDSTVLKSCVANNVVYDDHCYTGNSTNISNSANSNNSTNYTVHNTVQDSTVLKSFVANNVVKNKCVSLQTVDVCFEPSLSEKNFEIHKVLEKTAEELNVTPVTKEISINNIKSLKNGYSNQNMSQKIISLPNILLKHKKYNSMSHKAVTLTKPHGIETQNRSKICVIKKPEKEVIKASFNDLDVVIENSIVMSPTLILDGTCNNGITISESITTCDLTNADSITTCDVTNSKSITTRDVTGADSITTRDVTNADSITTCDVTNSDSITTRDVANADCIGTTYVINDSKVKTDIKTTRDVTNSESISTNYVISDKKVIKKEPEDINKLLEQLGDNYTTSVFDIEDPFLVIEISDSSDSEIDS